MDEVVLRQGFSELAKLSWDEYRQPLDEVAGDPDPEQVAGRVGRLLGVMLKEPFADPEVHDTPSAVSRAYRSWHLLDQTEFDKRAHAGNWQYDVLQRLSKDEHYASVYGLIKTTDTEKGLFRPFARNLRRYICSDAAIRQEVSDALKQARLPQVTPENVVGAGGLGLGAYLVSVVPIVGMLGAPAVAAVVLIIYKLGVKGFCEPVEVDAREDQ